MTNNLHYYLIHGIDPTRKPFMENQFKTYGIPESAVTWITYPNKNDPLPDVCTDRNLPKGVISCTYKHYLALKDIVEKGYEYAIIMEDNIEFRNNVPNALERYLKDLPADWDCLFDSDFFGLKTDTIITPDISVYKQPYGMLRDIFYTSGYTSFTKKEKRGVSKGAHFIFLTQKAAKQLYDIFLPFHVASDHHYNFLCEKLNLNVYWAEPPNVHKIDRPSTWKDDYGLKQSKFIWRTK